VIDIPWWTPYMYGAVALPFLLCVLVYGLRSPWRRSRIGWAMMSLYASLLTVLVYVMVATIVTVPDDVRIVLRVLLLGGVMVAGWVQLAMIVHEQRRRCSDRQPRRRDAEL
jgi:hypothetical protein